MAITQNLSINQGSSFSESLNYVDNLGNPVNLTGFFLRGTLRESYYSVSALGLTSDFINAANGQIRISLNSEETTFLDSKRYVYDVEAYLSGNTVIRLFEGIVTVNPGVSQRSRPTYLLNKDTLITGNVLPKENEQYSLGSPTLRFKDLYLSGNTISLGGATLSATEGGGLVLPESTSFGSSTLTEVVQTQVITVIQSNVAGELGATGPAGPAGLPGATGEFIAGANVSEGNLIVFTNLGNVIDAGYVIGPTGPSGEGFISANTVSGNLVLITNTGNTIDVGYVLGATGPSGNAGEYIASANVVSGNLVIVTNQGNVIDAGSVAGPSGEGIVSANISSGNLVIITNQGNLIDAGSVVGPAGDSVSSVDINQGNLVVITSLGNTINAGYVMGPTGPEGPAGNSITGATGPQGATGETGPTGPQGPAGNTSVDLSAINQSIVPDADITYDLGSSSYRFRDLYLSGSTINLGNATISASEEGGLVLPESTTFGSNSISQIVQTQVISVAGNIAGPTGPQGATGPQGPEGPPGATGPMANASVGATGATGPAGNATAGATGATGLTGATGPAGSGGNLNLSAINQSIIPDTDVTYDLGSANYRFRDLFLSGNTIILGNASISASDEGVLILPESTLIGTTSISNVVNTIAAQANAAEYIASANTSSGNLIIITNLGNVIDAGAIVGTPGEVISAANINNGNLVITTSLGNTINAGYVVGPPGATGPAGNATIGATGATGAQGPQGATGPMANASVGATGATGPQGATGASANLGSTITITSQIFNTSVSLGSGVAGQIKFFEGNLYIATTANAWQRFVLTS